MNKIAQEIADRILVSGVSRGGAEEVRIQINDAILPGTEIRIYKEGEQIRVEIITTSEESLNFLSSIRANLQDEFKDRVSNSVNVEIKKSESGNGNGRSRQQRDIYENN